MKDSLKDSKVQRSCCSVRHEQLSACTCIWCPLEAPEHPLWRLSCYLTQCWINPPNRIIYYSSDPHNGLNRDPVRGSSSPGDTEYGIICTYHFEEIFILFISHVHSKIKRIQSWIKTSELLKSISYLDISAVIMRNCYSSWLKSSAWPLNALFVTSQQIKTLTWTRQIISVYCRGLFWRYALGWRLLLAQDKWCFSSENVQMSQQGWWWLCFVMLQAE